MGNKIKTEARKYQSNALWPPGVCPGMYNDNITTDEHDTQEQAAGVCRMLRQEGFSGDKKVFPLFTWVSGFQQPPQPPRNWNAIDEPGYENPTEAKTPMPKTVTARAPQKLDPVSKSPWLEAAIAWEVCASIHREYARGKDPFYITRQKDFDAHAERCRLKHTFSLLKGTTNEHAPNPVDPG